MNHLALGFYKMRATLFLATLSLVALTSPSMGEAQTTNITSSGLGTTVKPPVAGTTSIVGGTAAGTNLFHSFGNFSIGAGELARFETNNGSANSSTSNIISRVTGTNPSSLFGTLDTKSYFPSANFFLVNPNGIVFGANASINVGGSANFVAGDYLRMTDNAQFFANPAQTSTLSVNPVSSFGFLSGNPLGTIQVQGGTILNQSALTLVGRDKVNGTKPTPGIEFSKGTLSNPGGSIRLISVGTPKNPIAGGEVNVSDLSPSSTLGFNNLGSIHFSSSTGVNTGANAAGSVFIRAGQLVMDESTRISAATRDAQGGNITIEVQNMVLAGKSPQDLAQANNTFGAVIDTGSLGSGRGGDIRVNATESIIISQTPQGALCCAPKIVSGLFSQSSGAGDAGHIFVATPILSIDGGNINTKTFGGRGGDITVDVGTLRLNSGGKIETGTWSTGNSGNIHIHAWDSVQLSEGGNFIETSSFGKGSAGIAHIATPDLVLSGGSLLTRVVLVEEAQPGKIEIDVARLTMSNRSQIETFSRGNGGDILIKASDFVSMQGEAFVRSDSELGIGGQISITAPTLIMNGNAAIRSDQFTNSPDVGGSGGNITLNLRSITMNDSTVSASRTTSSILSGNAGGITIQGVTATGSLATSVSLNNSAIRTTIAGGKSETLPANIAIAAQAVTLSNGSTITASTTGNAPAGNIGLVTQQLTMISNSAITSNAQAGGAGKAGSITITGAGSAPTTIAGGIVLAQSETTAPAGAITLTAPGDLSLVGTTVSVKNTGAGNAGGVNLTSGNNLLVRNSLVSTESAQASGGDIKLTAPNIIRVVDSTLSSSVQGQVGSNGGNINIDPQLVVIQNSNLLANANAGAGGNITVIASGAVLVDPNSQLNASAGPAGVSGSVNINTPVQVLGGALVPLKIAYSQAGLSGDRCAADPKGQFSSFVQTGRDGVPQVPGALSPSPLSFLDTLASGSLDLGTKNLAAAQLGFDSLSLDDSALFRFHSACRS